MDRCADRAVNLGTLLAQAAGRFGPRPAIGEMSFSALLEAAHAVRDALQRAGIAPDEPVHVRVSNQPLDFPAYLGVWLAGAVVVPVHRSSPEGAVTQVLGKTRARFEWDGGLKQLAEQAPPRRPILEGAALIVFTSG